MSKPHKIKLSACRYMAIAITLVFAPIALAADADLGNDIQIRANYMRFDTTSGNSTYEGDVKISQGSLLLSGDKIVIRRKQDEIQDIIIDGKPAQFIQDEHSENKIVARSQHMKYLAKKNRLIMTIDAHLEQPDHIINSQRIVYDTKNKIVIAGDSNDKQTTQGGRVNIILTPKKDKESTPTITDTEKP